jgi:hypothetical protein
MSLRAAAERVAREWQECTCSVCEDDESEELGCLPVRITTYAAEQVRAETERLEAQVRKLSADLADEQRERDRWALAAMRRGEAQ